MPLSKRNRRGILIILLIGLLIAYTPRLITYFSDQSDTIISFEELNTIEQNIVKNKTERKDHSRYKKNKYSSPSSKFDPNDYSKSDWMKLGLSEKQALVVLKFTSRGIRSNDELKRIFVIPEQLYELMIDSVYYKNSVPIHQEKIEHEKIIALDLNKASVEELDELPGIGPFYANKIVEHREELGGYINKAQLLEIWKFDNDRLEQIDQFLKIEDGNIRKISINKSNIEELKDHPYLSYKVANSIVNMREVHGSFEKVDDIKRSKLIDEELFNKLKPYLKL